MGINTFKECVIVEEKTRIVEEKIGRGIKVGKQYFNAGTRVVNQAVDNQVKSAYSKRVAKAVVWALIVNLVNALLVGITFGTASGLTWLPVTIFNLYVFIVAGWPLVFRVVGWLLGVFIGTFFVRWGLWEIVLVVLSPAFGIVQYIFQLTRGTIK